MCLLRSMCTPTLLLTWLDINLAQLRLDVARVRSLIRRSAPEAWYFSGRYALTVRAAQCIVLVMMEDAAGVGSDSATGALVFPPVGTVEDRMRIDIVVEMQFRARRLPRPASDLWSRRGRQ
jgi:hypothetical protein